MHNRVYINTRALQLGLDCRCFWVPFRLARELKRKLPAKVSDLHIGIVIKLSIFWYQHLVLNPSTSGVIDVVGEFDSPHPVIAMATI